MKRTIYILLSLTAVLACTKTEVAYDDAQRAELSIAPVAGTLTKAAIADGETFPISNHLSLFAYHAPNVNASENVADYSAFNDGYLYDAEYYYTGDEEGSTRIWGGLESSYYWPITGSLVFAGYSLPAPTDKDNSKALSPEIGSDVYYDLGTDLLKITGYTQSTDPATTYDFLYFGRTQSSYNNRRQGEPISLTFNHALAWIVIKVTGGTGATMTGKEWSVTKVTLQGVNTHADFTFKGTAAGTAEDPIIKWELKDSIEDEDTDLEAANMVVYDNTTGTKLTNTPVDIENGAKGILVIPQSAKDLSIEIKYLSPAGALIEETIPVELSKVTPVWESGKKYTYNLTFKPKSITVDPQVGTWDGIDKNYVL